MPKLVLLLVSILVAVSALSFNTPALAGGPPSHGGPPTEQPWATFTTSSTIMLPPDSQECAALRSRGAECQLLVAGTGTVRRVGKPASGGVSSQMAGTTNWVCHFNSCNAGQGDMAGGWSCGQQWVGSWSTRISDPTGWVWWSKVSYSYHGTLCQNVYFDSVDCADHGGNGTSVTVNWCGNWNNGGASPYLYADGGDNITVSAFVSGFPLSAGHWQRLGIDIYLNWGISIG